jgi:uncharacterized oxidoreductase
VARACASQSGETGPSPSWSIALQKAVLITGGTSGIGKALAAAYLKAGAAVAVCGRSQEALDRFALEHPKALAIAADVTDRKARTAMLNAVARAFGRLDVLVNNAGVFIERNFVTDSDPTAGLDEEIAINLTGPIHLTNEVLARWPSPDAIVFVTSGFALVSPKRAPSYGAAKAGLHAFADSLRLQLADRKTDVLELLPPTVDTPMNAKLNGKKMAPEEVAKATLKALAAHREMALPGDTAMLPLLLRLAPGVAKKMVSSM